VEFFESLVRLLLAVTVVFGLLFGLRWYALRRIPSSAPPPSCLLRVRERLWLAQRSQAVIIEVGDQCFLVCFTDHAVQIAPLTQFPPRVSPEYTDNPNFAAHLEQIVSFLRRGGKS